MIPTGSTKMAENNWKFICERKVDFIIETMRNDENKNGYVHNLSMEKSEETVSIRLRNREKKVLILFLLKF